MSAEPKPQLEPEPLLTVDQVAAYLQKSRWSIYQLVAKNQIPHIKISERCTRFDKAAIDAWLKAKSGGPRLNGKANRNGTL